MRIDELVGRLHGRSGRNQLDKKVEQAPAHSSLVTRVMINCTGCVSSSWTSVFNIHLLDQAIHHLHFFIAAERTREDNATKDCGLHIRSSSSCSTSRGERCSSSHSCLAGGVYKSRLHLNSVGTTFKHLCYDPRIPCSKSTYVCFRSRLPKLPFWGFLVLFS